MIPVHELGAHACSLMIDDSQESRDVGVTRGVDPHLTPAGRLISDLNSLCSSHEVTASDPTLVTLSL